MGHFYLTKLLLPKLKKSKEPRIINVSSIAHFFFGKIDWTNYNSEKYYNRLEAYSRSKLSNIYFSMALTEKVFPTLNIKAFSVHPGIVDTDLYRHFRGSTVMKIVWFFF